MGADFRTMGWKTTQKLKMGEAWAEILQKKLARPPLRIQDNLGRRKGQSIPLLVASYDQVFARIAPGLGKLFA